jgi:hypothetical protein
VLILGPAWRWSDSPTAAAALAVPARLGGRRSVLAGDVAQELGRLGQRGEGGGDNLSAGERLVAALAARGRASSSSWQARWPHFGTSERSPMRLPIRPSSSSLVR